MVSRRAQAAFRAPSLPLCFCFRAVQVEVLCLRPSPGPIILSSVAEPVMWQCQLRHPHVCAFQDFLLTTPVCVCTGWRTIGGVTSYFVMGTIRTLRDTCRSFGSPNSVRAFPPPHVVRVYAFENADFPEISCLVFEGSPYVLLLQVSSCGAGMPPAPLPPRMLSAPPARRFSLLWRCFAGGSCKRIVPIWKNSCCGSTPRLNSSHMNSAALYCPWSAAMRRGCPHSCNNSNAMRHNTWSPIPSRQCGRDLPQWTL